MGIEGKPERVQAAANLAVVGIRGAWHDASPVADADGSEPQQAVGVFKPGRTSFGPPVAGSGGSRTCSG